MHENVGNARKTNKKQTELPSQIRKGNMKKVIINELQFKRLIDGV